MSNFDSKSQIGYDHLVVIPKCGVPAFDIFNARSPLEILMNSTDQLFFVAVVLVRSIVAVSIFSKFLKTSTDFI